MVPKTPKIKLTMEERADLRKHKIKLSDIALMDVRELRAALHSTEERAREIKALAQFQTVPSVGPKFAKDLVLLQYYSLDALKDQDGGLLYSDKQWWDFTEERKQYRLTHGYSDRPN